MNEKRNLSIKVTTRLACKPTQMGLGPFFLLKKEYSDGECLFVFLCS